MSNELQNALDRAAEAVDAYKARFATMSRDLLGPIDPEIKALSDALDALPVLAETMKCPFCADGQMYEHRELRCGACNGAAVNRAQVRANIEAERAQKAPQEQMAEAAYIAWCQAGRKLSAEFALLDKHERAMWTAAATAVAAIALAASSEPVALQSIQDARDALLWHCENPSSEEMTGMRLKLDQKAALGLSHIINAGGVEMSPEFTDTARAALLWVLWHHQGGNSPVGQPIRFALGIGAHDRLNEHQIAEAKRWAAQTKSTTEEFHRLNPMSALQAEAKERAFNEANDREPDVRDDRLWFDIGWAAALAARTSEGA